MKSFGKLSVLPRIPAPLSRLTELAHNLRWSWEPTAQELFARLDANLWESVNHNPVKLLRVVQQEALDDAAVDADYLAAYHTILAEFDAYMAPTAQTWFGTNHADKQEKLIAYFSAEFGLHESLSIYSGGLGILSGDHCKAASDLALPFVGIGFLYPQGYFTQRIDVDGMQQAEYEKIDFAEMPVAEALDPNGKPVLIHVDLPGRTVYAKVWRIQVGRIPVFLMDTDVERNAPQDRELSARLYGGDREMRISQEIVLGIGGVRALRALDLDPSVWHMNEGHSAFLGLERIREHVQANGLTFDEAVEAVRADSLFTTHTPVPAGNDAFAFELVEKFFWQYWGQLGLDRDGFLNFAHQDLDWGPHYSMTVLALRLSAYHNGVSKLHGQVSREMWNFLWPETPPQQVPIGHITNGVHVKTWLAPELRMQFDAALGRDWLDNVEKPETWAAISQLPDQLLWQVHQIRKELMIKLVRERAIQQIRRHGEGPQRINAAAELLNPRALTFGFARRFATYKRATLIFRDEERLLALLNDPERPIQIVFSGKAHPADEPGKALIQHVYQLSQKPEYWGKIIFVENYDMNIARHLVAGVDVWLNTPRRPHEASGTSGQKAALSGVPNFSVLDGWWVEGYQGPDEGTTVQINGWPIGDEQEYKDSDTQDEADAIDLYNRLENEIIPLYFALDEDGLPAQWIATMKESIRTCGPQFSMRRMVIDYTTDYYLPAAESGSAYQENNYALARQVCRWKRQLQHAWTQVHIEAVSATSIQSAVGDEVELNARVWLNGFPREQVAVEVVVIPQTSEKGHGLDSALEVIPLKVIPLDSSGAQESGAQKSGAQGGEEAGTVSYRSTFVPKSSGQYELGVRIRPNHTALINPHEIGLSRWG